MLRWEKNQYILWCDGLTLHYYDIDMKIKQWDIILWKWQWDPQRIWISIVLYNEGFYVSTEVIWTNHNYNYYNTRNWNMFKTKLKRHYFIYNELIKLKLWQLKPKEIEKLKLWVKKNKKNIS